MSDVIFLGVIILFFVGAVLFLAHTVGEEAGRGARERPVAGERLAARGR